MVEPCISSNASKVTFSERAAAVEYLDCLGYSLACSERFFGLHSHSGSGAKRAIATSRPRTEDPKIHATSLVHDVGPTDQPSTHVLVIGIGEYPHLVGGTGPTTIFASGMAQLTSPPVSARAFAKWVIEKLKPPKKSLASVSLLLSESEPKPFENPKTGELYEVPSGTAQMVEDAIGDWAVRCAAHPDNLAIFYFCGHGIAEGSVSSLLMRDFGAKANKAFDGAVNLGELLAAMGSRLPNRQLFVIDACRVSTPLSKFNVNKTSLGRTCLDADPTARFGTKDQCLQSVLHSTLEGAGAYGRAGAVSLYTEAFLKALKGSGGHGTTGQWQIETTSLQTALHHLLTHGMALPNRLQVPETTRSATFELHLPAPVEIITFVSCNDAAVLSCSKGEDEVCSTAWDPTTGSYWQICLEPDNYNFGAQPKNKDGVTKKVLVYSPVTFVKLEV